MNKLFLAVLGVVLSVYATAQDTIINAQNNTISCVISNIGDDGVSFTMPPKEAIYRMSWANIKAIYYNGSWQNTDELKRGFAGAANMDTVAKSSLIVVKNEPDAYDNYLEKAGRNLILGIAVPIGGAVVGFGVTQLEPDDAVTAGLVIIGGSTLIGIICELSAGNNLIKAQRYHRQQNTTGFKWGAQRYGTGIAYRF